MPPVWLPDDCCVDPFAVVDPPDWFPGEVPAGAAVAPGAGAGDGVAVGALTVVFGSGADDVGSWVPIIPGIPAIAGIA